MTKFRTEEVLAHYDSSKYQTPDGYTADIAILQLLQRKQRKRHRQT